MIDVLPVVQNLYYSEKSEWLFNGKDSSPRKDIPAFPPFIRFGKCECSFQLRTVYS